MRLGMLDLRRKQFVFQLSGISFPVSVSAS